MDTYEIKLAEKVILWSEIFSLQNPDTNNGILDNYDQEKGGNVVSVVSNYDFENTDDRNYWFYNDITFAVPNKASLTLRSTYLIEVEKFQWEQLFTVENILPILKVSVENTIIELIELCKINSIDQTEMLNLDSLMPEHDQLLLMSQDMVNDYSTERVMFTKNNAEALNTLVLKCPMKSQLDLTFNYTFLILDEILFNNLHFKRSMNRETFFKVVPEMKYNSLKLKCLQIREREVALNDMDFFFLIKCMDCAVQLLLGNNADYLIPISEERGVTAEVRSFYFKSVTELFEVNRKRNEGL
jgi:hypothetical protein